MEPEGSLKEYVTCKHAACFLWYRNKFLWFSYRRDALFLT